MRHDSDYRRDYCFCEECDNITNQNASGGVDDITTPEFTDQEKQILIVYRLLLKLDQSSSN